MTTHTHTHQAILRAQDLCRQFHRRKGLLQTEPFFAVRQAEIIVHPAEVVAVIGESGCGKTTLSRMLTGMLEPTNGYVQVQIEEQWRDLASLSPAEERAFRQHVQMVYQESDLALDPMSTVFASVLEGYRVNWPRVPRRRALTNTMRLLHELGLEPRQWRSLPGTMSGGERKRAVIARAFAALGFAVDDASTSPLLPGRLLIADEPTASLDCATQARLLTFFLKRQAEMGLAYLIISHDLALVRAFSHYVIFMYGGRAVERGTVEKIWPHQDKGGVMHPYSRELLGELISRIDQPTQPDTHHPGCIFRAECPYAEHQCQQPQTWHGGSEHQWACWKAERLKSQNPIQSNMP